RLFHERTEDELSTSSVNKADGVLVDMPVREALGKPNYPVAKTPTPKPELSSCFLINFFANMNTAEVTAYALLGLFLFLSIVGITVASGGTALAAAAIAGAAISSVGLSI